MCNCDEISRDGSVPLNLPHVPTCPHFTGCVRDLLESLVRGIESWATDEDGVHWDAWDAYSRAKLAIGEPVRASVPVDAVPSA